MRISTAVLSTLLAGSSLSLSMQYAISQQEVSPTLSLADLEVDTKTPDSTPTSAESANADPAPVEPATQTTESAPGNTKEEAAPASPTQEPAPAPESTATPSTPPAPELTETTVVSDVITYKYGVVQVSVTALGQDITGVQLLQGDATYGRDVAYEALINATIQTDGTNYGNVSGATFTTEAFKKAISNAIGKL